MKRIICVIIMIAIVNNTSFASIMDIDNHWASSNIIRCINNEYIIGYEDNTFKPNNYIKWNEFIKLVVKIINSDIQNGKVSWDEPYIEHAQSIGLLSKDIKYYNDYIKRGDVVDILYNFLKLYNVVTDNEIVASEYLKQKNILNGYQDNTLKLDNNITRAESVVLLNRTIDFKDEYIYNNEFNMNELENENVYNYTNYKNESSLFLNTYYIKDEKVIYSDLGRFSIYNNIYIERYNNLIINILKKLINNGNYVLNTYVPESKCILVAYGIKDKYVDNGSSLFEIMLFEEKQSYLNYEYTIKINIHRLWKELNEIKNGIAYNKYYVQKFKEVLGLFISPYYINVLFEAIEKNETGFRISEIWLEKQGTNYYIYI